MTVKDLVLLDCEQGSSEWLEARKSIPTATGFSNIITNQGKPGSSQTKYMAKLLSAHMGVESESFTNKHMERGNELEPKARLAYSFQTGNEVTEVGGVFLDGKKNVMISPDGLIFDKHKGLEIKCPMIETHVGYCLAGVLPSKYILQVQGAMWVTGFDTWDFVSYCPEWTPKPLFLLTIKRDEKIIAALEKEVRAFSKTLEAHKEMINLNGK